MDEEGKDWKCVYAEEFETRLETNKENGKKIFEDRCGREF